MQMKPKKFLYPTALLLALNSSNLQTAAGTLDLSYGPDGSGIFLTKIGRTNDLSSVIAQPDDKLLCIGTVTITMKTSGISRLTAGGSFDTSFNGTGFRQLLVGSETILNSIALQDDGKAVVGGFVIENKITKCIVARYDTTGNLDPTFGGLGYGITNVGNGSTINAILIQPDGKIVAGGVAGEGQPMFTLMRYNTDGTIDTTFGNEGIAQINPGYTSVINAIALQSDGKILAAGLTWNLSTNVCALARFNSDGSVDETFGTGGYVTTAVGSAAQASALAIQQDGNIVIAGDTTDDFIHHSFLLLRYDTFGNPDHSFNSTGQVITFLNFSSGITALALQSDGKILAGGYDFGALSTNFALARYLPSGALDQAFGTEGIALTSIGNNAIINDIAILSDGKIIAAGTSDKYAAIARYYA